MRNRFDRELSILNTELIEMGALIENAIDRAVGALFKQDESLAESAIEFDSEVDRKERDIESRCLKLLLQQQPVARDLRTISSALKNDYRHGAHRRSGGRYCGNYASLKANGRSALRHTY